MKRNIPMITTFAFAAAAQAAVCLQDVFAPEVTGVPPTFAHREMCRTDDGEIRHYGQVMRGGKVCRVYAASRDEGLSWRLFPAAEDDVGALVKSPWSGEWLTVCARDGVQSVRSKKGPSGGDAVLTPVTAPGFMFFRQPQPLAEKGHWLCAGAAIDRDPTARPGSQRPAVLLSGDDGRTWRMVVLSNVVTQASEPTAPDAIPRWENYCCEPTVDQRRDGTLQMFVRTSTDHNWRYLSHDGGETWTGPEKLPHFFASNTMPTLLRLSDGRLLYFWNNTVPLPKLPSQTGQVLAADEASGRWETVFTNRDVLHAAISEDDGETWIGFREIRLNEHRNDADYRELGNDPAQELDKSVHQSQALELPGGKVLLAAGQNSAVRRFIVFDPAWLYETERHEDFRHGLGNVCHFLYVKGPVGGARGWAGHCTWNRVPGARMVLDPDLPAVIIGSMGGNEHGKDEWADLKNIDENLEMLERFCSDENGGLIGEIGRADRADDAAVAAIGSAAELKAKQSEWRAAWLTGIGGLPEAKTPLNAKTGSVVKCDGFTLQNVLFESQPGVYVVGHLFLPDAEKLAPPYPCVMMPMGHSDAGILNLRYATHAAMTARAGLAVFSWDPIGQGERRQIDRRYDAQFSECAREHSSLGARGWLIGWNFARFRIWDAIRAVDYVLTRREIDGRRLGVMGTSGGGAMSAYMQAWDERITVAFPNCFVSSIRAVFGERGCYDAEQFFFGQLTSGVNHAAILALGRPRVALAIGSRWRDYFPHSGAVETFEVFTNMVAGLRGCGVAGLRDPWHFSCDGPHGLPASTRAAQTDWMRHHLLGAEAPRSLAEYWALDPGPEKEDDPSNKAGYPFDTNDTFFTSTHQVRDLPGFKSVYSLIADRALELKAKRTPKMRERLREIVRRRANIRPLAELSTSQPLNFSTDFNWWYLKGPYGVKVENKAAILSTIGRSYVGEQAEAILRKAAADVATNGGQPLVLKAKGWDCIAAAHAYAAEPQLFSGIEFTERPPSWTEMATNPDTKDDSIAIGVWGALVDYDWVDLVK